jgi:hypothetical protein
LIGRIPHKALSDDAIQHARGSLRRHCSLAGALQTCSVSSVRLHMLNGCCNCWTAGPQLEAPARHTHTEHHLVACDSQSDHSPAGPVNAQTAEQRQWSACAAISCQCVSVLDHRQLASCRCRCRWLPRAAQQCAPGCCRPCCATAGCDATP